MHVVLEAHLTAVEVTNRLMQLMHRLVGVHVVIESHSTAHASAPTGATHTTAAVVFIIARRSLQKVIPKVLWFYI